MPVSSDWSPDNTSILVIKFSDPWTIPEMIDSVQQMHQMMQTKPDTVHVIFDASQTRGLPNSVLSTFITRKEMTKVPANQGYVLVIAQTTFLQSFMSLAKRVLSRYTEKMFIVDSMESALERLHALTA